MSDPNTPENTPKHSLQNTPQSAPQKISDLARLGARLTQIRKKIQIRTLSKRRKQNLIVAAGAVLILLCTLALARLTIQSRALDAEGITRIGRAEVQKRLPDTVHALEVRLKADAPLLVNQSLHSLVEVLPELRQHMVKGLNERLDTLNSDFEQKIVALMNERVRATRSQLDEAYPDLSDREKLSMLVSRVAVDFRRNFTSAIEGLYPHYAAEMQRINGELNDLKQKSYTALTREEKLKKEIISTMVRLAHRSRQDLN